MMERMHGQGGVYGGVFFLFWGGKLDDKKIQKLNTKKALDGCHLISYTQKPTKNMRA
jgi:hypothetical protein